MTGDRVDTQGHQGNASTEERSHEDTTGRRPLPAKEKSLWRNQPSCPHREPAFGAGTWEPIPALCYISAAGALGPSSPSTLPRLVLLTRPLPAVPLRGELSWKTGWLLGRLDKVTWEASLLSGGHTPLRVKTSAGVCFRT